MSQLNYLFESLDRRYRPEDIADSILELMGDDLKKNEKKLLQKAAKQSLRQRMLKYTSMLQDFARPIGFEDQIKTANNLFITAYSMTVEDCQKVDKVEAFIRHINKEISKTYGNNDFMHARLNRELRQQAGLDISRRRYNKLFRHIARMESKLVRYLDQLHKLNLTKIGKSGLAHKLSWQEFASDKNTACFVAYYTARSNLRSEFTIFGQKRAFDDIANMLFKRCEHSDATNWWVMAHTYPHDEVLAHLNDEEKGVLIGRWFSILEEVSDILHNVWNQSNIDRDTMIVRRGNDSSTWNNMANAWNKARDNWIALIYSLGMDDVLDTICFGKVMRLMAADVVAWHRSAGGGLDPNTYVWRDLPLPWEVLKGDASCTKTSVDQVCQKYGLDPEKTGWIAPRPRNKVESYSPTPELVHGISVGSPILAKRLRKAGYFSGKTVRDQYQPSDSHLHGKVLHTHHQRLVDENPEND